jgi:hypothetical protein
MNGRIKNEKLKNLDVRYEWGTGMGKSTSRKLRTKFRAGGIFNVELLILNCFQLAFRRRGGSCVLRAWLTLCLSRLMISTTFAPRSRGAFGSVVSRA